ncbi:hypothetical protein J6590_079422, partial [Homalodisca vitripennis]
NSMVEKCAKCNTDLESAKENVAKCNECGGVYHSACCKLQTTDAVKRLRSKKGTWRCDSCETENASSHSSKSDTTT